MKQPAWRVVVAVVTCLLAAPAAAQQPTGPKDRGFALEIHLGTRVVPIDIGGPIGLPLVDGGFFAGYKFGRFTIGGSLEYGRAAHDPDLGTKSSTDRFIFMPGVRIAILRSADERVELYGQADVGFGHQWISDQDGAHVVAFQVGPGVRLWFHPNFAAAAMFGLRGEHYVYPHDSYGYTGLYATLAFTGVF
jgi:hypothetical protein